MPHLSDTEKDYPEVAQTPLQKKHPYISTGLFSLLITFCVLAISGAFYFCYSQLGNDASPDSIAGYAYAILGTLFLLLAVLLYSKRRLSGKHRTIGRLHTSLHWHICFGIIGLALLFMHSFGNFNPRSGTYALYGLIALVISGFIGRVLDRFIPKLIAREVDKALTVQGEDRIETISQKLQAIVVHNKQEVLAKPTTAVLPLSSQGLSLQTSWDLAYISLEATPQELSIENAHYRFIPDKKSNFTSPGALFPGAQEQISALKSVQQAMQRELFYRYIIRYWRAFHILLSLLTLILILWHLIYAAQLLLPLLLHS